MLKTISSIIGSSTAKSVIRGGSAGIKSISSQSGIAPSLAFGGSLVAGVVAAFIGGFKIADCIRYQTQPGQCDAAIEKNLPAVVGGIAAIAGCWGGFNTYNPKLHKEDSLIAIPAKELVIDKEPMAEPGLTSRIDTNFLVAQMREAGKTQQEIADELGMTKYAVRKALRKIATSERGR